MNLKHNKDPQRQIITSRQAFGLKKEWHMDEFTQKVCPIPLEEFQNYNIPLEIVDKGFDSVKNFLSSFGKDNFISFTGLK